jgi:type IV secretion system protein VirB6
MADATAVFSTSYTFIDHRLHSFLNESLARIIDQVETPLRVAIVLYIILYGIAVLRGAIAEPILDFAVRAVKICVTFALATSIAYTENVTSPLFHDLPNALARSISGSNVTDVGGSFDQFFAYGAALSGKISNAATPVDILSYIVACVVFVVTALAASLGFGVVIVAKVALALLVALGPIFIACSLFEASRRFFFGWLSQGVNYVVLFALIITIFQLVLALMAAQWPTIDGEENLKVAGMVFSALCLLGAIFFLQVPSIAAGIAGGASTGVADFFGAMALAKRTVKFDPSQRATPTPATPAPSSGSIRPARAPA